jgi:hypothetical protein
MSVAAVGVLVGEPPRLVLLGGPLQVDVELSRPKAYRRFIYKAYVHVVHDPSFCLDLFHLSSHKRTPRPRSISAGLLVPNRPNYRASAHRC